MDLTTQIIEKTKQIQQLTKELNALYELQIADLRSSLLGKYVQLTGEKGWNKGMVTEVRSHALSYVSIERPQLNSSVVIKVEYCGQSRNVYDPNKVRLMTPDEIAKWQKSTAIDRTINERAARVSDPS